MSGLTLRLHLARQKMLFSVDAEIGKKINGIIITQVRPIYAPELYGNTVKNIAYRFDRASFQLFH